MRNYDRAGQVPNLKSAMTGPVVRRSDFGTISAERCYATLPRLHLVANDAKAMCNRTAKWRFAAAYTDQHFEDKCQRCGEQERGRFREQSFRHSTHCIVRKVSDHDYSFTLSIIVAVSIVFSRLFTAKMSLAKAVPRYGGCLDQPALYQ